MNDPLHVLLVEDSETDAKLVLHTLRRAGHEVVSERVDEADALIEALARRPWDLVISDWTLPRLGGREALSIVRASNPDLPFIIVSGTAGEQNAVEAMRCGAQDYVIKGNLVRLPQAVARELRESASRREHRRAQQALRENEERFKRLSESGIIGILVLEHSGRMLEANDTFLNMVGLERARLEHGDVNVADITAAESQASTAASLETMRTKGAMGLFEKEYVRPDGTRVPVLIGPTRLDDQRILSFVLDLSERKRLEQVSREAFELEQQNRRMQEASRMKSEFLANMSHELRTPLNAIIGFGELLYDGVLAPESPQHHEAIGDIVKSGRHLLRLINDVLDLARVEAGKLDFRPVPVDLELAVNEVISVARTLAAEKSIRLDSTIDPELKEGIFLDPVRLKQILYNFISNALKFTPEQGWVNVRARPYGADKFLLEVEDTGIGIAPEDIERLFVEFQQLEAGTAREHGGTGLGLAMTRRLAEAQGGSVGVESVPDRGSVFHAILPRRSPAK